MRYYITDSGKKYNRFLDCIKNEEVKVSDLNDEAIMEFLVFGSLFFEETFLRGVKKIFSHQEFIIDSRNGVEKVEDSDIYLRTAQISSPESRFLNFFGDREAIFRKYNVTIDLTGGIDSRLVATVLHKLDIPFHAVYSLDSGDQVEAKIVEEVANTLQCNLNILKSESIMSNRIVDELFTLSDGMWDILGLISLSNVQNWRRKSGFNLVITGIGGELYKDFWWQQDFPFYHKKKVNIERLMNMRFYPLQIEDEWLGDRFSYIQKNLTSKIRKKITSHTRKNNTQTYDQIYLNVKIKEQVSVLTNATMNFLTTYSPLLERDLLQIGYNLPRRERLFNFFHRKLITKLNPTVAKIPTTEGSMSVSSHLNYMLKDSFLYGVDKTNKLLAKTILTKNRKISTFKDDNINNMIIPQILQESIETLKEVGIFSKKMPVAIAEIPEKLQGRILTLGMLIKQIK